MQLFINFSTVTKTKLKKYKAKLDTLKIKHFTGIRIKSDKQKITRLHVLFNSGWLTEDHTGYQFRAIKIWLRQSWKIKLLFIFCLASVLWRRDLSPGGVILWSVLLKKKNRWRWCKIHKSLLLLHALKSGYKALQQDHERLRCVYSLTFTMAMT